MKKTLILILKKIIHITLILLLLSLVVFSFIRMIPGDPVKSSLGPLASEETIAEYRHQLYFDRPLLVQWGHWLAGIVTKGDFGTSLYTHRAVSIDIAQYLPRSLELCILAAVLILAFGVLLGTISALFRNTWVDNLIRFVSYLGIVTPAYAFGIIFMLLFAYHLHAFPIGGFPNIPDSIHITGAPALDCLLSGQFGLFVQCMRSYFLPCISVAIGSVAYQARIHRSSMVENINADYIAFAEVAGVNKCKLICKHLMKPSFIPTLTVYGLQVASLLGNAFIIENIFRINGFSQYALNVILNKDPYGIISVTMIFGIMFSVINMLVDIGVALLDPRIRLRGES